METSHGDRPSLKQFSKLIDVREGTMLVRQKWSPQQVKQEGGEMHNKTHNLRNMQGRGGGGGQICKTKVVPLAAIKSGGSWR